MGEAKENINREGKVYCKYAGDNVTILFGTRIDQNGYSTAFTKVLCPFYKSGFWGGHKCAKGGKCGIAEGASR